MPHFLSNPSPSGTGHDENQHPANYRTPTTRHRDRSPIGATDFEIYEDEPDSRTPTPNLNRGSQPPTPPSDTLRLTRILIETVKTSVSTRGETRRGWMTDAEKDMAESFILAPAYENRTNLEYAIAAWTTGEKAHLLEFAKCLSDSLEWMQKAATGDTVNCRPEQAIRMLLYLNLILPQIEQISIRLLNAEAE